MPQRHDLVEDPHAVQGLHLMRQATANFLRLLSSLDDDALQEPSEIPTWRRSHLVAYLGVQARRLAETAESLRSEEFPLHDLEVPTAEIDIHATLPRIALHNFFRHSAVHLDVELRDLPHAKWNAALFVTENPITVSSLVWWRAEELWSAAVLLRAGQNETAIPAVIRERGNSGRIASGRSDQHTSIDPVATGDVT